MKSTLANLKIIIIAFTLFSQLITINSNAQTTRVLFIGNSLTGVNNLPNQFRQLALSAGKQVFVEDATAGGATLQNHLNNTNTISKIQQGNWDYVVLQEQSQLPSWVNDRSTMFYPYAKSLDSIFKLYNPCGETVFFLTYAHRNGDLGILQNGGTDSYWAMQQRIRDGYMEIADSLNAVVCPVGWAFRECRIQYPTIELYQPDFNHPTDTGTYLAACAFYSTIFQDSAIGQPYIGSMPLAKAAILQNIATHIVMDSLVLWNIGQNTNNTPISYFNYFDTLLTVHFVDSSTNALSYLWDFGDGDTSSQTNPIHTYSTPGNYTVRLIIQSSCGSDTFLANISVYANNSPPNCDFSYTINNLSASYIDSSQNANTYFWDFGDGDTSNLINPIHNYLTSGIYLVKHRVNNNFGSDSIIKQISIYVQMPIANFNYSFSASSTTVFFNDSSQYTTSHFWDFDDGDTSTQANPSHIFPHDGTFDVKLVASNNWGTDTIVKQVDIQFSSIEKNNKQSLITIYPNPLHNIVNIATNFNKYRFELRMIDNKILIETNESKNTIIDISGYPKGMYIIVIETEDEVLIKKIMKY